MKVIAIDDEPLALSQITKYIEQVPFLELSASFTSSVEARKFLQANMVDAMWIDINMPDINGIELVRSLPKAPLTVFTTAYSEYAIEGYKVDAVDYLLKPFTLAEFIASAEKVRSRLILLDGAGRAAQDSDFVFFKSDYKIIKLRISDIVYVESMSEYLKIHLANEDSPRVVLMSFAKLQEKLPQSLFIRIHRSYVINLSKVAEVSSGMVLMEDGRSLPVSESYRAALLSQIG